MNRIAILLLLGLALPLPHARAVDSRTVKRLFTHPPREYSTAPLWVWNDQLTEAQIRDTLRDLAGQQVKQVFIHPRPGLMTPYLSADWFRLWKVALDEAAKLDMNVWIYDENSYPSGFAGGWVPELMPEARGRGLILTEVKSPPAWATNTLGVFRLEGGRGENVSAQLLAGQALPAGRYLVATVKRAANSPWNADRCYVDLLYPGVTEKFLEVTHEAYRREVGGQFGKRIPGSFADEPELRPAGGLPWTEDLPQQFERRWGYSLLDNLASLSQPVGDWQKIRHNYYQTLLNLFTERWGKPYFDYCARQGLEFTGHYWEHDWPNCQGVPDNMAMSAWQQRPGIDILMNQYAENTHAQFGNVRACREISSVANQFGRRTLVELYGAGGWDLRFADMKRIGDWLEVLGVNTLDQHLSYITIRGARKRDHPQSFSYHEPWWPAYHTSASYFARLSAAMTQGQQVNRVLVLEPTTTAWMHQGHEPQLRELGDSFFQLLLALEAAQVEYDLGCEDVIARQGSIEDQELRVGQRRYHTVVIPPNTGNLNGPTWDLLHKLTTQTGHLLACDAPLRRDGALQAGGDASVAWNLPLTLLRPDELLANLTSDPALTDGFRIRRDPADKGILFHHRRLLDDGQILLLVNTSSAAPSTGRIESALKGVERWNLETGGAERFAFEKTATGLQASYNLPPSGSLLLFLSKQSLPPAPVVAETTRTLAATGPMQIRRLEPNVLTLDYVDITAGGETRTNAYFYPANRFAWQKNGLDRDPWDSAVQFKDELIRHTFPPGSGFVASYRFTIEGAVAPNLAIVVERPDLYTVTCNGHPVSARTVAPRATQARPASSPGARASVAFKDWWLDKAFGRIDIAAAARVGENVVTIAATPFTMFHELEPAYLLGDFTLRPAAKGFVVTPDRPLTLGPWNEQGLPFFSQGAAYRQQFELPHLSGRYLISLPDWLGSVAEVRVNGKPAGYVTAPPWECNVTKALKRGVNTIEVVVIGTLKNTLGPHHGNPALGAAWPRGFQVGPQEGPPPGRDYSTVGYGLFAPFVLQQVVAR